MFLVHRASSHDAARAASGDAGKWSNPRELQSPVLADFVVIGYNSSMSRKRKKHKKNSDDHTSAKYQKQAKEAELKGGGMAEFLTGLGFQVSLFVLFVIFLGLVFHYLPERRISALWFGFGAW